MNRPVVLLLLAAGLAGCAAPARIAAPAVPATPDGDAATVLGRLPTADSLWPAFRIEARLSWSTPDFGETVSSDIRVRGRDTLWVRLRGPLGIEAARALVTRDSIYLHDRLADRLYVGDRSSGLLPAGLAEGFLAASFFGFDPPRAVGFSVVPDSAYVRLERADGTETVLVDRSVHRMVLHERRAPSGGVLESRRFGSFDRFSGLVLPRRIVAVRPPDSVRATFVVRSVEPEPAGSPDPFDFPPDLVRRRVN